MLPLLLSKMSLLLCLVATVALGQSGVLDTSFANGGVSFDPVNGVDEVLASVVLDDTSHMFVKGTALYRKYGASFLSLRNVSLSFAPSSPTNFVRKLIIFSDLDSFESVRVARLFPGGGVLIAGCVNIGEPGNRSRHVFASVVDQRTGAPVTSFGVNGTVLVPWSGFPECVYVAVLQADSFLLVGSGAIPTNATRQAAVIKMGYDGTLVSSWGENGVLILGPLSSEAQCGFLLPSERVLLVGTIKYSPNARVLVQVLSRNGTVEQSEEFAYNATFPLTGRFANSSTVSSCVRTPSGAFVVAGVRSEYFAALRLVVMDGVARLDESFGNGGSVVLSAVTSRGSVRSVIASVLPTGSVVLSGQVLPYPFQQVSIRLLPSGAVDPSWSSAPIALGSGVEFPSISDVQVLRTGKMVLSGYAIVPASSAMSFALIAEPSSVPCSAGPQCLCVGLNCMTQGDYVAPGSIAVSTVITQQLINGTVSINGNLIGSENGQIVVRPPPFGAGQVTVGGVTVASGTLVVQVNQSGTYTVVTSTGGFVGSFDAIVADSATLGPCQVGDVTPTLSADGSTISVLVNVRRTSSLCLTPGETIGVAVGVSVGGLLLAVAIILFARWQRTRYTTRRNKELKDEGLQKLRGGQQDLAPNPAFLRAEEL